MNAEQILAMEAGPELDALVAEKVMGAIRYTQGQRDWWAFPTPGWDFPDGASLAVDSYRPSTDHNHAMEVAAKAFGEHIWIITRCVDRDYRFRINTSPLLAGRVGTSVSATALTLPLAICRAACIAALLATTDTETAIETKGVLA